MTGSNYAMIARSQRNTAAKAPDISPGYSAKQRLEIGGWAAAWLIAAVIAVGYVYYSIFSLFQPYDDEGYVLISLRSFFEGKPLYDQVYSSFQPGFYVVHWLLFKCCGVPLSHDSIRLLTLVLWLAAAGLNGLITHRLTGSVLLALFVSIITVQCLQPFANEPGHPQALAYVLVAAFVGLFGFADSIQERPLALALGAVAALLLLIKINVGAFAVLAAALLVASAQQRRIGKWLGMAIGTVMLGLPVILWRVQLEAKGAPLTVLGLTELFGLGLIAIRMIADWRFVLLMTIPFAVCAVVLFEMNSPPVAALPVYSAGLLSLSICCAVQMCVSELPDVEFKSIRWGWALAALAVIVGATTLFIMLRGTSLNGVENGLLRWPAKVSTSFLIRPRSNWLGLCLGLLGATACFAYLHLRQRWSDRRWLRGAIVAGQLLFGVGMLAEFYVREPGSRTLMPLLDDLPHFWMLPFAWLAAVPETGLEQTRSSRLALLVISVMQPLIACPVAGTQLVPASMLLPVLGAVCLANGLRACLASHMPVLQRPGLRLSVGTLCVALLLASFGRETLKLGGSYASRVPLNLPGATRIRLTAEEVDTYRAVVAELARPEVDTFLTLPGLNSFYFWARKEPPNGLNVSGWVVLLDSEAQERIWQAAQNRPGLMVVRNRRLIRSWVGGRSVEQLPLVRHIDENFRTVSAYGGYELMVRR